MHKIRGIALPFSKSKIRRSIFSNLYVSFFHRLYLWGTLHPQPPIQVRFYLEKVPHILQLKQAATFYSFGRTSFVLYCVETRNLFRILDLLDELISRFWQLADDRCFIFFMILSSMFFSILWSEDLSDKQTTVFSQ